MSWKLKYRCKACGYERLRVGATAGMAEVYEGRGLFRQQITAMSCPDCKTIQNIVVGGIICSNIRIDTHRDNRIMRHNIEKHGFAYCGIIYLANGDERLAYQKQCCSATSRMAAS